MPDSLILILGYLLKAVAILLAANEIRGIILAGPVLYGMYQAGGSLMAIYLGICSLGGIALSVVVPLFLARRMERLVRRRLVQQ